jgi:plasmid stability protein
MVALQIREVPDDVRRTLAERARARGQSLQAFLLALVEEEARRSRNVTLLETFAQRTDGSQLTSEQAAETVQHARAERDRELTNGPGPGTGDAA